MFRSISITPCGNSSRVRSGKIRAKALAVGKLIMRTLGFWSNDLTDVESGAPTIQIASTVPSFIALTAAVPAKGKNVAVSEIHAVLAKDLLGGGATATSFGPYGNALSFKLRQPIKRLVRGVKDPIWIVVYSS